MTKECPNCNTEKEKSELKICKTNCDMIVCDDCKIEHLVTDHADFREIDEDEWKELD